MAVHFSESEVIQFVEVYKTYDCLWNRKHELYKCNEARQNAYREIVQKLNIPNLTEKDIPKKIKNLRSSYYQEIKRIRRGVRLGTKYKPRVLWFPTVDGFLKPFTHEREFFPKRPKRGIQVKNSNKGSIESRPQDPQNDEVDGLITSTKNLNKADDEYDSFGKYIASSIRAMPQEFSIIAKTELQKTISDIQLKIVRGRNRRTNSPGCSASLSSDNENQRCISPASDTCISSIKIEYDS